jgi:hypothetical protein
LLPFQEQELRADDCRHVIVDRPVQEDDPIAEHAGVDVDRTLPVWGLLNDHRNEIHIPALPVTGEDYLAS